MDRTHLLLDYEVIKNLELYRELIKWASEQQKLYQLRCSNGKDVDEWRKNQGRADAFTQVLDRLLHPDKFLDREKVETTTTGGGLV